MHDWVSIQLLEMNLLIDVQLFIHSALIYTLWPGVSIAIMVRGYTMSGCYMCVMDATCTRTASVRPAPHETVRVICNQTTN